MKKILIIILILLPLNLFAYITDDLNLTYGNDNMGRLHSKNFDDQLSYSANFEYKHDVFNINFDLKAYTNRGWKTAWTAPGIQYSGRYDYVSLRYKHKFNVLDMNGYKIDINPSLGLTVIGNFMFDSVQNISHRMLDIPTFDIKYDDYIVAPVINAEILFSKNIAKHGFVLSFISSNEILYETNQDVSLNFKYADVFAIGIGYKTIQTYSNSLTHKLVTDFMSGPYLHLLIDTGFYIFDTERFFLSDWGYGKIGVNLLSFWDEVTYEEDDLKIDINYTFAENQSSMQFGVQYLLTDYLSLEITNFSKLSSAMNKEKELSDIANNPNNYSRYKHSFTNFNFGLVFSLDADFISPYLGLSAGYMVRTFEEYSNTLNSSISPILIDATFHSLSLDLKFGLTIMPKDFLVIKNNSLRFNMGFNLLFYPMNHFEKEYFNNKIGSNSNFNGWENSIKMVIPSFIIGLQIGLDV